MYVGEKSRFEAGTFIRQNLKEFPNALEETCFDNFKNPPRIEFIATTSENAQARYIPQWLDSALTEPEQDTAIVLCNESLLQPVLHSLPDATSPHPVKRTNITMGFPMTDTPVYSFINALLSLQTDGYDRDRRCFRAEQEKSCAAILTPPCWRNRISSVRMRKTTPYWSISVPCSKAWPQRSDNKRPEGRRVQPVVPRSALSCPSGH